MKYQKRETKQDLAFLATFEQLLLEKETFDFFWSNFSAFFLRHFGQLFGKSRATCGKPYMPPRAIRCKLLPGKRQMDKQHLVALS